MKKILLATTVLLTAVFVSSQAYAGLVLTTTNGGSFTYDPDDTMGGDNFIVDGDNGLNDFAIYLGYQTAGLNPTAVGTPIRLTNGVATGGTDAAAGVFSNRGSIAFDTVTFDNGVSVDAVATFRLSDSTGAPGTPDPSSTLLYDLALTTSGVTGTAANEGSLQSLVGFDFGNNGTSDRLQPSETISGFGTSQVSIGDVNPPEERVLSGDFNFTTTDLGRTLTGAASNINGFNGLIEDNLNRFNDTSPTFVSGDGNLGFAAFRDFAENDLDATTTSAGVIGFRSVAGTVSSIPEPSALMMASMGLGMVAFRRRRKRQA